MANLSSSKIDQGVQGTIPTRDSSEQGASIPSVGDKTGGSGPNAFSKDGAIGQLFQPDGALGGTAQKIGGPFDKDGAIGSNFKADGSIGGTVQKNLGDGK